MEEDERGKLFVGGLSWETTQENLQRYFARYGEIIDCVVMKNNDTGRSRGFGFVTFSDPNNVTVVLKNGPHTLDGRTIDPKPCNPRTLQKPKKGGGYKIFLGGLPSNVTETDLRTFFGRYGKVTEVVIMYDQEKKKSRGFGFLSFEDEGSVECVTNERYINLNGKQVEIKKAEPRDGGGYNKMNTDPNQWNHHQGAPLGEFCFHPFSFPFFSFSFSFCFFVSIFRSLNYFQHVHFFLRFYTIVYRMDVFVCAYVCAYARGIHVNMCARGSDWVSERSCEWARECVNVFHTYGIYTLRLICLSASYIHQNANIWQSPSKETQIITFSHTFQLIFIFLICHIIKMPSIRWFSGIFCRWLVTFSICHIVDVSYYASFIFIHICVCVHVRRFCEVCVFLHIK